jgi:alpha-galactosidase
MTPETVALLTNKDVIAIDQDRAGQQGDRVSAVGPVEIWVRPLADGSKAVGIFNRHPGPMNATVDFKQLGFNHTVKARDLWQQKDLGNLSSPYTAKIPGHGVLLLRVTQ